MDSGWALPLGAVTGVAGGVLGAALTGQAMLKQTSAQARNQQVR